MKYFINITKIVLILFFLGYFFYCLYFSFFSSTEQKYGIAENTQGSRLSQKIFDRLIKENPNYSKLYYEKSKPYSRRGNYAEAFELIDKAVEINPENYLEYRGKTKLYLLKDYKGAVKDFLLLDSLSNEDSGYSWGGKLYYLLGIAYQGSEDYENAKKYYTLYYEQQANPNLIEPMIYVHHGNALVKEDSINEAIKFYDKAIHLEQNNAEAHYYKGLALKEIGMRKDSIKYYFSKAIDLYSKGYKNHNLENEEFEEIYIQDIEKNLKEID